MVAGRSTGSGSRGVGLGWGSGRRRSGRRRRVGVAPALSRSRSGRGVVRAEARHSSSAWRRCGVVVGPGAARKSSSGRCGFGRRSRTVERLSWVHAVPERAPGRPLRLARPAPRWPSPLHEGFAASTQPSASPRSADHPQRDSRLGRGEPAGVALSPAPKLTAAPSRPAPSGRHRGRTGSHDALR